MLYAGILRLFVALSEVLGLTNSGHYPQREKIGNSKVHLGTHLVFGKISGCGRSSPSIEIVNGTEVTVGDLPWHVAVYESTLNSSFKLICGGTIVSPVMIISGRSPN